MSPSTITVVIPVFNRMKELSRALDSLSMQQMQCFEVIVVDDGSEEDLSNLILYYQRSLKSLRYFRIENSGGPAKPRNIGILNSESDWISFLDSDDWWEPSRIGEISRHLSNEYDIYYHKLEVVNSPRSYVIGKHMNLDPLDHLLFRGNPIPNSSAVVNRIFALKVGGIDERLILSSVEDYDFWLRSAKIGGRFKFIDSTLGYYSQSLDGISLPNPIQIERHNALYVNFLSCIPDDKLSRAARFHSYLIGTLELNLANYSAAFRYFLKAIPLNSLLLNIKLIQKFSKIFVFVIKRRFHCLKKDC